jgi:hypothetical protein
MKPPPDPKKKLKKTSGAPTWPKNPKQDSFGNPTTKSPGQTGTEIGFKNKGRMQKWLDLQGKHKPKSSKDWR